MAWSFILCVFVAWVNCCLFKNGNAIFAIQLTGVTYCDNYLSKMFHSLLRSLLCYLYKEKCFGESFLFNLNNVCFLYHPFVKQLLSLWKFLLQLNSNCRPNSFRFFWQSFCYVLEKNKNVIHQHRLVCIGKICTLCLKYCSPPVDLGGVQDLRHSFSQYGPPSW